MMQLLFCDGKLFFQVLNLPMGEGGKKKMLGFKIPRLFPHSSRYSLDR